MEDIYIQLVDMPKQHSHQRETVYKSRAVSLTERTEDCVLSVLQPPAKKAKKMPSFCIQGINELPQDGTCYVMTATTFPVFNSSPTRTYTLLLIWNASHQQRCVKFGSLYYQDCGQICLTVDEVCSRVHSMDIKQLKSSG